MLTVITSVTGLEPTAFAVIVCVPRVNVVLTGPLASPRGPSIEDVNWILGTGKTWLPSSSLSSAIAENKIISESENSELSLGEVINTINGQLSSILPLLVIVPVIFPQLLVIIPATSFVKVPLLIIISENSIVSSKSIVNSISPEFVKSPLLIITPNGSIVIRPKLLNVPVDLLSIKPSCSTSESASIIISPLLRIVPNWSVINVPSVFVNAEFGLIVRTPVTSNSSKFSIWPKLSNVIIFTSPTSLVKIPDASFVKIPLKSSVPSTFVIVPEFVTSPEIAREPPPSIVIKPELMISPEPLISLSEDMFPSLVRRRLLVKIPFSIALIVPRLLTGPLLFSSASGEMVKIIPVSITNVTSKFVEIISLAEIVKSLLTVQVSVTSFQDPVPNITSHSESKIPSGGIDTSTWLFSEIVSIVVWLAYALGNNPITIAPKIRVNTILLLFMMTKLCIFGLKTN